MSRKDTQPSTCAPEVFFKDITKVHPCLKNFFGYCLFKVATLQRLRLEATLSAEKLLPIHFGIMIILESEGATSQIKMGDSLGIDKASMVKLIDHLENLHMIERKVDPKDRRVNLLLITDKGRKTFLRAKKLAEKSEGEFLAVLSGEEKKTLKHIMSKLLDR